MSRVQWFDSPFNHLSYTVVRDKKDCKKLGIDFNDLSLGEFGKASTNYLIDENGKNLIVVYMPKHKVKRLFVQALLCHECVHVFQEVKRQMAEKKPSPEFEAYSIQQIFQDLSYIMWGED